MAVGQAGEWLVGLGQLLDVVGQREVVRDEGAEVAVPAAVASNVLVLEGSEGHATLGQLGGGGGRQCK